MSSNLTSSASIYIENPSIFNELLGFLLPIFSLVPTLVPTYSSNRSLVRGSFSSLSLGGGVAVLL